MAAGYICGRGGGGGGGGEGVGAIDIRGEGVVQKNRVSRF